MIKINNILPYIMKHPASVKNILQYKDLNLNCLLVTRLIDKFSPGPTTERTRSQDLTKLVNLVLQSSATSGYVGYLLRQ